jgi:hypothetical protein
MTPLARNNGTLLLPNVEVYCAQVGADVASQGGDLVLRATTRRLVFQGYQAAYNNSFRKAPSSDDDSDSGTALLVGDLPGLKVSPFAVFA